ncbi:hypothetical protein BpHYR1_019234 [Brachionus plicatilis]|uniref:Uncharacterized protein n=1 Tax=Brachionus plicatilis TaxID=10195 RepID=A0A3M7R0T2_BRAPC|nr:hypothetical protein BpHYR1_019234 [Brachionus plicatilis]
MSKHHVILKSKTLDVPIIITSSMTEENHYLETASNNDQFSHLVNSKFKLDKGFSLDSHYLNNQKSMSSSITSNELNSVPNSISSSESSLQCQLNNFQFHNQQFLQPPPLINPSSFTNPNINADFCAQTYHEPDPKT